MRTWLLIGAILLAKAINPDMLIVCSGSSLRSDIILIPLIAFGIVADVGEFIFKLDTSIHKQRRRG